MSTRSSEEPFGGAGAGVGGPGIAGGARVGGTGVHGRQYALLDAAVERVSALGEEERAEFRDALDRFVRTYSFLSQVVTFGDTKLEADYVYCRALAAKLRDSATVAGLDLGEEVELTHLRNEVTFDGSLSLSVDEGEVLTVFGEGAGRQAEPRMERLSEIVEVLNQRFGLNLTPADRLLLDQWEQCWMDNPALDAQANANTLENFRLAFRDEFEGTALDRMEDNEALLKRILDDEPLGQYLMEFYASKVYRRARQAGEGPD